MYRQETEQIQPSGDNIALECAFTVAADFLFGNHLSHFICFVTFLLKLKTEINILNKFTSETVKPME